jgi:hypothetical protein
MAVVTLQIGDRAECASCGREIVWLGTYWDHFGTKYRHPAKPRKDTNKETQDASSSTPRTEAETEDNRR